jgi:hypothetical protein
MKLILPILIGSMLPSAAPAREASSITDWRGKEPLTLLRWCSELNFQSEATTRYFLGAPDRKEEYKQTRGIDGPSELWIYDLPGIRTLEVVMIRDSPKTFRVSRVSYFRRLPDGRVFREKWHFEPDSRTREKEWRTIDFPPVLPGSSARSAKV